MTKGKGTRPDMVGNKFAVGNKGGRPRTVAKKDLPKLADTMLNYFQTALNRIHEDKMPVSFRSFALTVSVHPHSFVDYKRDDKVFSDIYSFCKQIIKEIYVIGLTKGYFTPGPGVFVAKNETDMTDQRDIKHSGRIDSTVDLKNLVEEADADSRDEEG